jgi:hypothetical protein
MNASFLNVKVSTSLQAACVMPSVGLIKKNSRNQK